MRALRRKETFATSGSRLKVRFFGGWGFAPSLLRAPDWVRTAYRQGVPMGSDLPQGRRRARRPSFVVQAVKDPNGGNLDRVQIIKVWAEGGKHQERIFDVAWSGSRRPDAAGKLPAVGSTVDLKTARYANTIGAAQLQTVWTDPTLPPRPGGRLLRARAGDPDAALDDAARGRVRPALARGRAGDDPAARLVLADLVLGARRRAADGWGSARLVLEEGPALASTAACPSPGARRARGLRGRGGAEPGTPGRNRRLWSRDGAGRNRDQRERGGGRLRRLRTAADRPCRRACRECAWSDRHPAQRIGQGQPVFPARLQSRSRHGPRRLRRRRPGQHAQPWPRPGLPGPQLPHSGDDRADRLRQGSVPRRRWRFRIGGNDAVRDAQRASTGRSPSCPAARSATGAD